MNSWASAVGYGFVTNSFGFKISSILSGGHSLSKYVGWDQKKHKGMR